MARRAALEEEEHVHREPRQREQQTEQRDDGERAPRSGRDPRRDRTWEIGILAPPGNLHHQEEPSPFFLISRGSPHPPRDAQVEKGKASSPHRSAVSATRSPERATRRGAGQRWHQAEAGRSAVAGQADQMAEKAKATRKPQKA